MKTGVLNVLHSLFVLTSLGLLLRGNVEAQENRYELTGPIAKRIIFEDVYRFYVMQYVPSITIRPRDIKQDQLQREPLPEKVAKAYFAALSQGNYMWYESLLGDGLKESLAKNFSEATKKSDEATRELQSKYKDVTIEFTHRVDRQTDSIIHCRVISPEGTIRDEQDLAINFRGQIINLRGDIVYDNWYFTGATKRIKKTAGQEHLPLTAPGR